MMQPIALPRADSAPNLAYPLKLPSLSLNPMAEAQAAIILVDPSHRASPPETSLRSVFRLTAAEARLACALASGESLERICDTLGIGKETARTQLKNIFSKTGTHRQSELALTINKLL
jgi:DNA-binding CsgD family transcriptional regulator